MEHVIMTFDETMMIFHERIVPILRDIAEMANQVTKATKQIQEYICEVRSALSNVESLSQYLFVVNNLANNQFVLTDFIPQDMIERREEEDINSLAAQYLISDQIVKNTITSCELSENRLFSQSIKAYDYSLYDLSILGLTAVLDQVLSIYSGLITNVNFRSRCDAIKTKINNKEDLYKNPHEGKLILIFLTYFKALELFAENSIFANPEPVLLNRHWIMHGRTKKEYTNLDCVKVLNMIYGTIQMGQLAQNDQ